MLYLRGKLEEERLKMNIRLHNYTKPSITNCLIAAYVVIFIGAQLYGAQAATRDFALNARLVIAQHQYWRIFTSAFMHADLLHLLMNSYFIFTIGNGVEAMLGKVRYAVFVVFTIFTSSAVIILADWYRGANTYTIGASGFGFGLLGLLTGFAIMYPARYYGKYLRDLLLNIGIYGILFSMIGVNVSWSGHIGGFVGGLITALVMNMFFRKQEW
jgi:rhomboid protease GluP